jgi:hypothetical protein
VIELASGQYLVVVYGKKRRLLAFKSLKMHSFKDMQSRSYDDVFTQNARFKILTA